jgi:uncharacterized protein YjbI with pentapeptide repeats|tara:strand:- start:360 stop:596 length:237 start_codon:yes stop_codon:yes gene_type:complete
MKQLLATITVIATLAATSASAFDPVHLKRLKETNECNLSEANLEATNLTGANLSGTLMKGITLCNTTMPDGSVIYSGC